jgi:hypothetical protein
VARGEPGTTSFNTWVGWFGLVVLVLGVAAGITVPLVFHVSHWVTAVIILTAVLIVVAEGSYLEWKDADGLRRRAESALDDAQNAAIPAPQTVNPAEWKALCYESGTEYRALTFALEHRFNNQGEFLMASASVPPSRVGMTRERTSRVSWWTKAGRGLAGGVGWRTFARGSLRCRLAGSAADPGLIGHHGAPQ